MARHNQGFLSRIELTTSSNTTYRLAVNGPVGRTSKMLPKAVDPQPDSQQILNIRRIQGKTVIHANCVGDDLTRGAKAFQARIGLGISIVIH